MSEVPAEPPIDSTLTSDEEGQIPGDFPTYSDLAAIIQSEVKKAFEAAKVNNILIGWVTGLDPLTVRLLDGEDVRPTIQADGFVLELDDKVGLKYTVNGYVVTEKIITITQAGQLGMVPVGAVVWWPRNTVPPAGWYVANGQNGTDNLQGLMLVSAGANGFVYGASGGALTHTHTQGNTGSDGSHAHSGLVGRTNFSGGHDHGGNTGQSGSNAPRAAGTGATVFQSHLHPISTGGSHDHDLQEGTNTGGSHNHTNPTTSSGSNMPPYKVFHYIQYMGV